MASAEEVQKALVMLRKDAADRGMTDLAIVYGWSAIRLGAELLAKSITLGGNRG